MNRRRDTGQVICVLATLYRRRQEPHVVPRLQSNLLMWANASWGPPIDYIRSPRVESISVGSRTYRSQSSLVYIIRRVQNEIDA
jgi:hypothetical protein